MDGNTKNTKNMKTRTIMVMVDFEDSYGEQHRNIANQRLKANGLNAKLVVATDPNDFVNKMHPGVCDAIIIPHYYDSNAVLQAITDYDEPPKIHYLQTDESMTVRVPIDIARLKKWALRRYNISFAETFTDMCLCIAREHANEHARPVAEPENTNNWQTERLVMGLYGSLFRDYKWCYAAINSDPNTMDKNMTSGLIEENIPSCDVIVIIINSGVTLPFAESYQEILDNSETPIYVLYTGDRDHAKALLDKTILINNNMLKIQGNGSDAKVVLKTLRKHYFQQLCDTPIQDVYNEMIEQSGASDVPNAKPLTIGIPSYYVDIEDAKPLLDVIDADPELRRVSTHNKAAVLTNHEKFDIVIIKVGSEGILNEEYQKALDIIDKPIYVLHEGKYYLNHMTVCDNRTLKVQSDGSDAEMVIAAIREHFLNDQNGSDAEMVIAAIREHFLNDQNGQNTTVQKIYDRMTNAPVTKHVWLTRCSVQVLKSDPAIYELRQSDQIIGLVCNKDNAILYAEYTGPEDKVDAAIKNHFDNLMNVCGNGCVDARYLCKFSRLFLATFIQQEQNHGIDWSDGAEMIVDLCAHPGGPTEGELRTISEYCHMELA